MPAPDPNDPAFWDASVANYEAQSQPFTGYFAEAALALLTVDSSTRVLDVACGTGAATFAAAARGAEVMAIDFSQGMVQRVLSQGVSRVIARQMNGQALDLPDAAFDVAVSIFGVNLFPDWGAGLAEMARVTRPGGWAAVATWADPHGAATSLFISQVRSALFPETPMTMPFSGLAVLCDPGRLTAAMQDAGFADVTITPVTHDFHLNMSAFDNAERLFALIPSLDGLTPEQRDALVEEMRARAEVGRTGDTFPIPSTALIATAQHP
ncbi:2-methoxy-6-polyprenyl-1,4-benzoquinol methylase, mitochondrial [Alphaproteobacteria bacterium SO-S41]|nr:2-methoxy-6-polyprenyl-1,4-benzoquinol methylase, mitochondrial [Alphaproteobacteria bacterium SO-S41]